MERPAPIALVVSYVEDERDMYGEMLTRAGFSVLTFTDPGRALEAAMFLQPAAVITRILQPGTGFDGLQLTRQLRTHARTENAAVIAITSLFAARYKKAAIEAGCDALVSLPCLPDELIRQVQRAIATKERKT
jgi:two-component system, cell cycle response regulator DivK